MQVTSAGLARARLQVYALWRESWLYTYSLLGFYTASAPKETCSAQLIMNEECDEEMNMHCQTQELEKENHIERLKGIDVMHVCCMAGSIGSSNVNLSPHPTLQLHPIFNSVYLRYFS